MYLKRENHTEVRHGLVWFLTYATWAGKMKSGFSGVPSLRL